MVPVVQGLATRLLCDRFPGKQPPSEKADKRERYCHSVGCIGLEDTNSSTPESCRNVTSSGRSTRNTMTLKQQCSTFS